MLVTGLMQDSEMVDNFHIIEKHSNDHADDYLHSIIHSYNDTPNWPLEESSVSDLQQRRSFKLKSHNNNNTFNKWGSRKISDILTGTATTTAITMENGNKMHTNAGNNKTETLSNVVGGRVGLPISSDDQIKFNNDIFKTLTLSNDP